MQTEEVEIRMGVIVARDNKRIEETLVPGAPHRDVRPQGHTNSLGEQSLGCWRSRHYSHAYRFNPRPADYAVRAENEAEPIS